MTRDQLIELVLARLGQRQNDTKLQAIAVQEQQLVQTVTLEGADFKPWFLLSEFEQTVVAAGEYKVSLPQRFLEEWEEGALYYLSDSSDPTSQVAIPKNDWDYLKGRYPGSSLVPQGYAIAGTYFLLAPALSQSLTMQMRYYKRELVMDDAYKAPTPLVPTNKWTQYASDWFMAELGMVLAKYHTRDDDAFAKFQLDAAAAKKRIYVETVARQEANADRQMGED